MRTGWKGRRFVDSRRLLAPAWRVIAPDQRGHGFSDHALTYSRNDYLSDLGALFLHLGVKSAVLLGNSLGGVNAFQFATRHPERLRALVIEDVGVVNAGRSVLLSAMGGNIRKPGRSRDRVGARMWPYLQESARQTDQGWQSGVRAR